MDTRQFASYVKIVTAQFQIRSTTPADSLTELPLSASGTLVGVVTAAANAAGDLLP